MDPRFHVVTVLHPGGERLPILLDADRQPVAWINAYLIRRLQITRYEALEQLWLQRWQRIAFHCSRRGISIDELDRPLDFLNRKATRTRRINRV